MDATEFLRRTLPDRGDFFAAFAANGKGFTQCKLRSVDRLVHFASELSRKRADVYFATGSFAGSRTQDSSRHKRALYLDIDVGSGKPYNTKAQAIKGLFVWCDDNFIRPTILVDSGNGIHAYWTFSYEITTEAWRPLAEALKSLCIDTGLPADPTVTADAARVLRIPGTFNQKGDTPQEVKVLHARTDDIDYESVKARLLPPASPVNETLAALANDTDLDWEGGAGVPFFANRIIEKCNVLKHTYETGGEDQVEPLWMNQLSLMAYTVDGHEYIHTLSDKHKGYDHRRTERKFQQRVEVKESGKYGPPLCRTFAMYMPEKCKACRFNGHIKSPISLGKESEDASSLPFPYKQDEKNIYRLKTTTHPDGSTEQEMVKVLSFTIENFQLFETFDQTVGTVFRFNVPKYHNRAAEFTKAQLADRRQLVVVLSNSNIHLQPDEYTEFVKLMTTWAAKMVEAKQTQRPTESMGWTEHDDKPAFTLATQTLLPNGGAKSVTFLDKEFVKDFTPKGSRDVWLQLSRYLTGEDRHAITCGVLSAFASPLISFTGVNGCVLALVSDKSGTGKSTALRCAQAVWGDPRRGVNALDDTPLSVANRMGKLNNLPAFWDELRMREQVEKFVILMFQVTQGKERARLTSSISTRHVGTWNTLITVASNESITDHVRNLVHGTDAGLLRVFEVTVPYLERKKDIDALVASLDKNFGQVGGEYAQWLVDNHETVTSTLEKVRQQFSAKVQAHSSERFWVATCSALLTAAVFTNKLGFTNINIPEFTTYLAEEFLRSRGEQTNDFDPVEIRAKKYLFQFLDEFREQIIVFDRLSGKGVSSVGTLHSPIPNREILGVYAVEDKAVRIKKKHFTDWAYRYRNEPPTQLIKALESEGCKVRKASVTVGIDNVVHSRDWVIDMPLGTNIFEENIEPAD